jgi:hypothetical protein
MRGRYRVTFFLTKAVLVAMFGLMDITMANAGDCAVDRILAVLTTPLDDLKAIEREATESDATDGSIWYIYSGANGETIHIRRVDIGENYNIETRLSILDENTWGISRTDSYYLWKYGPIRRSDTTYFFYCHGIAEAIDNSSEEENAKYAKDALEVRDIFLSPDIGDVIKTIR